MRAYPYCINRQNVILYAIVSNLALYLSWVFKLFTSDLLVFISCTEWNNDFK